MVRLEHTGLGQTKRIRALAFLLAVLVAAVLVLVRIAGPDSPLFPLYRFQLPLLRLESAFLDFQFKVRGERGPDPDILIVAVDERSVKQVGRFPGPATCRPVWWRPSRPTVPRSSD